MSSCLSSRAYGFDLEHMVKWPCRTTTTTTTSNSSSPSSTLSESSNSPLGISTQKPRTPRKRPNQTYNEAAALLSMASPNIFKIKHLIKTTTNLNLPPKFIFISPPELISPETENSGFQFRRNMKKPCSLTDLKMRKYAGEIDDLDDFETESILNEEIEDGIDSIMGDCKQISETHEANDKLGYGYCPLGLGFGVRNRVRALKNVEERNWWDFPVVNVVVKTSPEKTPVGKKKKRVKELRMFNSGDRKMSPGNGERLELKLDYDGVLEEWGDKGLPLPEEISPSSSPGVDIQALAANIDLFTVDGDLNQSTATNKSKNVSSDQRPRSKGRFVKKPNSFVNEDVTH